MAMGGLLFY